MSNNQNIKNSAPVRRNRKPKQPKPVEVKIERVNTAPVRPRPPQKAPYVTPIKNDVFKTKGLKLIENILHPTREQQIPRPIPVRTKSKFETGQITWSNVSEFHEIRVQPDPFNLISIRSSGVPATVSYIDHVYSESFAVLGQNDHDVQITGGSTTNAMLQVPIFMDNGAYIDPVSRQTTTNTFFSFGHNEVHTPGLVQSYPGCSVSSLTQLTMSVGNNSATSLTCALGIGSVNLTTGVIIPQSLGAAVVVGQHTSAVISSVPGIFVPAPGTGLAIYVQMSPAATCALASISMALLSGPIKSDGQDSVVNYTIGEAVYGRGSNQQVQLDSLFTGSLLWAPVSMSATWNIAQQLNTAGGRFLTSYLPSHISPSLLNDYSQEWDQIQGYRRSYPVFDDEFVKGVHGSWIGARIADYSFHAPGDQALNIDRNSELPINVFMSRRVNFTNTAEYFLKFSVNIEVETLNPLVDLRLGPSSVDLLPYLLALFAANSNDLVGHNPDHLQRIKKLALKAWNDPVVRLALTTLLKAGITGVGMAL